MISANEIRRIAAKSGARDVRKIEIDILLTFLLTLTLVDSLGEPYRGLTFQISGIAGDRPPADPA